MRQYNAERTDATKVTFAGFDAQFTALAATTLKDYLTRVDPVFAVEIAPRLAFFEKESRDYSTVSEAGIDMLHSTAQGVAERLRAEERTYVARSSVQEWRLACQHARILRQVDAQRRAGGDDKTRYMIRDKAMAENVAWILENEGPRCKTVVWAHNGHVARDPRGIFDGAVESMGMHLARRFDPELVVVGFAFGEGAFQAVVKEKATVHRECSRAGARWTLDAILARQGVSFMLDLRHVGEGMAQ